MLSEETILHAPPLLDLASEDGVVLIDSEAPNWVVTDVRGADILRTVDGRRSLGEIASLHGSRFGLDPTRAWLHVRTVLEDGVRSHLLSEQPFTRSAYAGREPHLGEPRLRELWLQVNDLCNLTCTHCLVSSGPGGARGLPSDALRAVVQEGLHIGVSEFFVTGGEPFLRDDIYELIETITARAGLTILTNGTRCNARRLAAMPHRESLRLQVSCDGALAETNDAIRGKGSFGRIIEGIEALALAGVPNLTLACVVTARNLHELPQLPALCRRLGVESLHLMWLHRRGRAAESGQDDFVHPDRILPQLRDVRRAAAEAGVRLDNDAAFRLRLDRPAGDKLDLGNAGVESLCVWHDGRVYPSASFAGVPELECGSVHESRLADILRDSPVCRAFRRASVKDKELCRDCDFKFLCGGGDIEHSYWNAARQKGRGSILGADPYCELWKATASDLLLEMAGEAKSSLNSRSGFTAPHVMRAMGSGSVACSRDHAPVPGEVAVSTMRSNCVLSVDLDEAREGVRRFYARAATTPEKSLCCPTSYPRDHVGHIPPEVVERFYGCGSPILACDLRPGEVHLDLGSGAGIDCFIAAKLVGPSGRSIGVDMTEEMLEVARGCAPEVAARVGFSNVEFRHGFLESLPVEGRSVDCLTSNCVVNLSPDKGRVFAEMWRVLRDHGRIVVSDIVSDLEVPQHLRADARLWGECLSGALTEDAFLAGLERAGFYGVQIVKKSYWKHVEQYAFHSITVRGYKYEKSAGCVYTGQTALYLGPAKAIVDEEGHFFPRGVAVEVCTDTAAKLSRAPYANSFAVTDPARPRPADFDCYGRDGGCC